MSTSLNDYRKLLLVNRHRLDEELELQPEVMMRIASEVTLRNSRMIEAKDLLARVEARVLDNLRDEGAAGSIPVMQGRVTRHRERVEAFERWQAARAEYEEWSALLDAWRQRGFSMNKLAELYADQYWSKDSAGASERQRARNESSDEARASLRRAVHAPLASQREEPSSRPRKRMDV